MRNDFLDHGDSDNSDSDAGYDSEAAELSKGTRPVTTSGRSTKRRKLSHSDDNEQAESDTESEALASSPNNDVQGLQDHEIHPQRSEADATPKQSQQRTQFPKNPSDEHTPLDEPSKDSKLKSKSKTKDKDKKPTPGVVYLSSLPPYLKPSALRNLLVQRGFEPITRLFLTPASKAKSTSKKNSRQLYTEGWIEFGSKKTARRCAETLNAQIVGGKKGGFYYDDLWNMKYLRGMSWSELMSGIREEKREEEGRRDEERRTIARETKRFVEGVEEGKRIEGIKRKRSGKQKDPGGEDDIKRTWRQFEVKGSGKGRAQQAKQDGISDDVKEVLGKIF